MPCLARLSAAGYPLKYAVKKRLRLNIVFRGPVFDTLYRCRGYRCHRKISITDADPIYVSRIGQCCLVIGSVCERVSALMPFDITIDPRHGLGLDMIKIVVVDGVVANAGTDQELGIGNRLPAFF